MDAGAPSSGLLVGLPHANISTNATGSSGAAMFSTYCPLEH
jgi:hypothetical protein